MADPLPDFTVAICLYGNCDLLDVAGPNEVFTFFDAAPIGRSCNLVSVGKTKDPLSGIGALAVTPQFDLRRLPAGRPAVRARRRRRTASRRCSPTRNGAPSCEQAAEGALRRFGLHRRHPAWPRPACSTAIGRRPTGR